MFVYIPGFPSLAHTQRRLWKKNLSRKVRRASLMLCPITQYDSRQIANNSLFIEMATTLWALDLQAPRDAQGQPVVPDLDVTVNTANVMFVILYLQSMFPVH